MPEENEPKKIKGLCPECKRTNYNHDKTCPRLDTRPNPQSGWRKGGRKNG